MMKLKRKMRKREQATQMKTEEPKEMRYEKTEGQMDSEEHLIAKRKRQKSRIDNWRLAVP